MSGPTQQEILNHITNKILALPAAKLGTSFATVWDHLGGQENVHATGVTASGTAPLVVKGTITLPGESPVIAELHFTGDPVTTTTLRLPRTSWTYSGPGRRDDVSAVRDALYLHQKSPPLPVAVVTAEVNGPFSTRFELPLPVPGGGTWAMDVHGQPHGVVLASRSREGPKLTGLAQLKNLPGLSACDFTVPEAVPAQNLRLADLLFVIDPGRRRLHTAAVQVTCGDWAVSSDAALLDLKNVRLGFTVALPAPPGGPAVSASLSATIGLANVTVPVEVSLPALQLSFATYLEKATMATVLPDKAKQQWSGTNLSLEGQGVHVYGTADMRQGHWMLGCGRAGPWTVAEKVQLKDLAVEVSGGMGGGTPSVSAHATAAVDTAHCDVTMLRLDHAIPRGKAGWVFQGAVRSADLTGMAKWFGLRDAAHLRLDAMSVVYSFASGSFCALCDAWLGIEGRDLHLGMSAEKSSKSTTLLAALMVSDFAFPDVFPILLTGQYASDAQGTTAQFSWESTGGLSLDHLARYLGIQPPSPTDLPPLPARTGPAGTT
ncbi:hypothetical protein ACF06Q_26085 [Streptomyces leeuwenhoekii]|uniref:hypothetical protein n=1 Tax=Streptomyces leeuwenhoekii TaxID=1437453 RepID=UPI0036F57C06